MSSGQRIYFVIRGLGHETMVCLSMISLEIIISLENSKTDYFLTLLGN